MSMTLAYIDNNNDQQGIIRLNNKNHVMLTVAIDSCIADFYNDARIGYNKAVDQYDREQREQAKHPNPDLGYLEFLKDRRDEARRWYEEDMRGLLGIDHTVSQILEIMALLVRWDRTDKDTQTYASFIISECTKILRDQGNPETYWA